MEWRWIERVEELRKHADSDLDHACGFIMIVHC